MIAIVNFNKNAFNSRWIEYCEAQNIDYKIVDVYRSDIIEQLADCDSFMWHWNHCHPTDHLFARQLIASLELKGVKTFPNLNTCWHFDDKVGQTYLFDAIGIKTPKNWVFYTETEALNWAQNTSYPVVAKLRGGAGSSNVKLIHNATEAKHYIKKSFKNGFSPLGKWSLLTDTITKWHKGKASLRNVLGSIKFLAIKSEFERYFPRQIGYAYFQEFIPQNDHDIRIIVIGQKRAFAIKRMVRENDFRASGSGNIIYDTKEIPVECVKISFDVASKMKSQSIALDFVFNQKGEPVIIENSYGFMQEGYDDCEGYWDENINFHHGTIHPQWWMVNATLNIEEDKWPQ